MITDELEGLGLERAAAERIAARVERVRGRLDPVAAWMDLARTTLRPDDPFEVHRRVREILQAGWEPSRGPFPLWQPVPGIVERSNLARLMQTAGCEGYPALHRWSVEHREAFWQAAIEALRIRFQRSPSQIMDLAGDVRHPRWLVGARLNIVESCFQAAPQETAIVFGPAYGGLTRLTYGELRALATRVSNGLLAAGFRAGDAIAIDMAMTPEAVAIYLGIVQAGCVVVAIADSLATPEIATRLRIAGARGIFTAHSLVRSGKRLPLYEKVIAAGGPRAIVLPGPSGGDGVLREGDLSWSRFLGSNAAFEPRSASPADPITILFSSGTTAEPKAIPWDHTTPIKCAADGHYHHDIHPGDVVAWPTNLGWMMGPWLIFATLINRGVVALFEEAPMDRAFGRFVEDARVNLLGVVPSLVRRWRETNCMKGLDWSRLRAFSSTGECSNAEDMFYLMHLGGYRPIIEYCGGTEIGGGYITSTVVQPNAPGVFSTPALGLDVVILDEDGRVTGNGELFLVPPSIGLSTRLLNREHDEVYFQGTPAGPRGETLRRHGDQFERLTGGWWRALGRADDTMNLGGIKVSSAEIERALLVVPGLKEAAAIAVAPPGGGPSQLIVFVVLTEGVPPNQAGLLAAMQAAIRERLNPLFKVHELVVLDALPRTASQKVMRRELRARFQANQ